jgi:hypothetical protein
MFHEMEEVQVMHFTIPTGAGESIAIYATEWRRHVHTRYISVCHFMLKRFKIVLYYSTGQPVVRECRAPVHGNLPVQAKTDFLVEGADVISLSTQTRCRWLIRRGVTFTSVLSQILLLLLFKLLFPGFINWYLNFAKVCITYTLKYVYIYTYFDKLRTLFMDKGSPAWQMFNQIILDLNKWLVRNLCFMTSGWN